MWICTNKSFLSMVAHRDDRNALLVRARMPGHIEAAFPKATVYTDEGADYFFRAVVSREDAALFLAREAGNINYDNFKNSVADDTYHDALSGFWSIMYRVQAMFKPRKNALWEGLEID